MKIDKPTKHATDRKPRYQSPLRQQQAGQTRDRISQAAATLLDEGGAADSITFKAVAQRAGVTEMTVYRHFPTRADLLQGLWSHLNRKMAPGIGMPASRKELLDQHEALFAGFDSIAPQIVASITTPQGREMRHALDDERRAAFTAIVNECAPGLPLAEQQRYAAILQLLHSAYAWDSLREQWNFSSKESAQATRWALETLMKNLRTRR